MTAMNNNGMNYTNTSYTRPAYNAQPASRPMYDTRTGAPLQNAYARPAYAAQSASRPMYDSRTGAPLQNAYNSQSAYGQQNVYNARPAYNAQSNYSAQPAQRSFKAPDMQKVADMAHSTGYSVPTLIGIGAAVIGTICGVTGLLGSFAAPDSSFPFTSLFFIGFLLGIVAYVLAGGITRAIKGAWKVAKFTWFVIPVFPIDLILGLCGLVAGVIVFTAAPIIFVMQAVHEKYGK